MKISTRGRYGLRAMADLARESRGGRCVSLKSVAERQGLSEGYLEQLIIPLKAEGFIKSVRGAQGGYMLTKPPNEISVGDVLRALEGSLAPAPCVDEGGDASCGGGDCTCCNVRGVWDRMYSSLNDVVDSISIEDLLHDNS